MTEPIKAVEEEVSENDNENGPPCNHCGHDCLDHDEEFGNCTALPNKFGNEHQPDGCECPGYDAMDLPVAPSESRQDGENGKKNSSSMKKVISLYPQAFCGRYGTFHDLETFYRIQPDRIRQAHSQALGHGKSESEAWNDAASTVTTIAPRRDGENVVGIDCEGNPEFTSWQASSLQGNTFVYTQHEVDIFIRSLTSDSRQDGKIRSWTALDLADHVQVYEKSVVDQHIAALTSRLQEAERAIEYDRSALCGPIAAMRKALKSREWLRLGRGSYEWNDDRWRDEFGQAIDAIYEQIEAFAKIAADWTHCSRDQFSVTSARINWKTRAETAEAALKEAQGRIAQGRARLFDLIPIAPARVSAVIAILKGEK